MFGKNKIASLLVVLVVVFIPFGLRAQNSKESVSNTGNKKFISFVKEMQLEDFKKGDFESSAELNARRAEYVKKMGDGRGWSIKLPISNQKNSREKIVYFDVDTSEVKVDLPRVNRSLVWMEIGGKNELRWLHNSFIAVESETEKLRSYKASNRLGASIDVVEMSTKRYGFSVLSKATEDYGKNFTQKYASVIDKNIAKDLLSDGYIVYDLILDSSYVMAKDNPIMLKDEDSTKPTFDYPFDIKDVKYSVPVRLMKIILFTKAGEQVASFDGTYTSGNSLSK